MEKELKLCPFCGEPFNIQRAENGRIFVKHNWNCLVTPGITSAYGFSDEESVIKHLNTRPLEDDLCSKLKIAKEAMKAADRCYQFMVALHKELDQLQHAENDTRALLMAQIKINLFNYLSHVWDNGELLRNDQMAIANALAKIEKE